MKKTLCLALTIVLLLATMPGTMALDNMGEAIQLLSSYMSQADVMPIDISRVIDNFSQFGNRDKAVEFKFYSMMLRCISVEDWEQAGNYIRVLEAMKFDDYLLSEDFKNYMKSAGIMNNGYANIRPVSEVQQYIEGRKALNDGRIEDAFAAFLNSYSVLDAANYLEQSMGGVTVSVEKQYMNALALYAEGKIDDALQILVKIKDVDESYAALYEILISEKRASLVTPTPEPTPAPTVRITPRPTTAPTKAPTTNPPAQNTGRWSDWSENVPSSGARTETKTQYRGRSIGKEYRYRTLTQTTTRNQELSGAILVSAYNDYGPWSAWSDTAISSSSTREVETQTVNLTQSVTYYSYSRYRFIHKDGNWHYSAYDYSNNKNYLRNGEWQYTSPQTSPRKVTGNIPHANGKSYTLYEGNYYNESVTTKDEVVGTKTQYRSRDIYIVRVYNTWSGWSGWSSSSASASATCEVETRDNYGYWSAWEDTQLNASSNFQVETRTLYRYWIN